jgi:hypothetical protein
LASELLGGIRVGVQVDVEKEQFEGGKLPFAEGAFTVRARRW